MLQTAKHPLNGYYIKYTLKFGGDLSEQLPTNTSDESSDQINEKTMIKMIFMILMDKILEILMSMKVKTEVIMIMMRWKL